MVCQQCGELNDADAAFCVQCSHPVTSRCRVCGTKNSGEARYCKQCGSALDKSFAKEQSERLKHLQRSAPKVLQHKLKKANEEIEGQRKPVTILFTDIVGSTSIAEKLDPEIWKEIVADVHKRVGEAVFRYEGTIAQLLGDGVLIFFGAPLTHEDDPIRAVMAAVEIQERIDDYARELRGTIDLLQLRIGIHSGTVVVGDIGIDKHVEYLAIGDAVNVAARLQSAAEPGKIYLSEACAKFLGPNFQLQDLGRIKLKGKRELVHAYELLEGRLPPKSQQKRSTITSTYVGRSQELDRLRSCLQALAAGHGQILTVMGEAGIGKTRLVEEGRVFTFDDSIPGKSSTTPVSKIYWLEGRALSYGRSLAYWTITQLLLDDLGLSDGTPQVEVKVALRKRVEALFAGHETTEVLHVLGLLLGISHGDGSEEARNQLDGEALKQRTVTAIRRYFKRVALDGPVILVFEDLHWADPSSLETLNSLLALTDQVPMMILMVMRIDRDHGSWEIKFKAETDYPHRTKEIHLRRLSEVESAELMKQNLGELPLPRDIWRTIMDRSEGNPFYLEEVILHLLEQGLIEQDEQGWRASKGLEQFNIPDTLQGVLLARIDRLEADIRHTLQMASVIGKSFLYKILETISNAEQELDNHLSMLQRVDLVREKTRLPELEYMFKHALTQEAAYNSLLLERRKDFHQKVGEALEQIFPDRVDEFLGLIAYHFEAAEVFDKALDYLLRAGDQARHQYAHQEAIDYYNRALEILRLQNEFNQAAQILMKLGLTYHTSFDFTRSRQSFDEAFEMRKADRSVEHTELPPATQPFRMVWMEPPTLDPWLCGDVLSLSYIQQLFSSLIEFGDNWEIMPDIAHRWEVSNDGLTYTFHLRDDVFWSDGNKVTAHDFKYACEYGLDPETRAPAIKVALLYDIKNAKDYNQGRIDQFDEVCIMAVDDLTFEVELEDPSSYFLYIFSALYPLPRHVIEEHGSNWTEVDKIVTNGPFLLESLEPGHTLNLTVNPRYHGQRYGNLQKVSYVLDIPSDSPEELELFQRDAIDVAFLRENIYKERFNHADNYISEPQPLLFFIGFNTRKPPFDDLRVRKAFAMALDKEVLAGEVLEGLAKPATGGQVPPSIPGHSPGISYEFDPQQARKLLDQAGYKDGQGIEPIELIWPDRLTKVIDRWRSQWKANLNIELNHKLTDWKETLNLFQTKPLFLMGVQPDYPDPDAFLRAILHLLPHWQNEEFFRCLKQAKATMDQTERIRWYQETDRILVREAATIPLFYWSEHWLVKPWVKLPSWKFLSWYFKNIILEPH